MFTILNEICGHETNEALSLPAKTDIVIFAAPRSASQFLYGYLAAYFDMTRQTSDFDGGRLSFYYGRAVFFGIKPESYVIHSHDIATAQSIRAIEKLRYYPIFLTRPFKDCLPSLFNQNERNGWIDEFLTLGHDASAVLSEHQKTLSPDERLDFLVDFATPRYCAFVNSWRNYRDRAPGKGVHATYDDVIDEDRMVALTARICRDTGLPNDENRAREAYAATNAAWFARPKEEAVVPSLSDEQVARAQSIADRWGCPDHVTGTGDWRTL